ncbi:50S ribosomal protein L4 [Aliifodinibius sp. S!AR15-10]|uniref:50S ribosomal protein L4 n=1 Tax=Aliifodinibius sp. S!AR15-10 TaxID=2950437 RepID=UPI002858966F|nr:50S ribosomal protein L4 [Aliifodinibius sp. S!AR15-10]MDR8394499.1 50S ribosomal protein L4 [Aliifodinibius sp. S!AR15-10]
MKLSIFNKDGQDAGSEVDLRDSIFDIEPNETVVYEDVRRYLAHQRQGTAKTKERSEVRGGGRKAYRQKGTGMARRGSIRSPLLKGGGTVFGPKPRKYEVKMTKKMRRLARKSALSQKAAEEAIRVVEDLEFEEPKTSRVADLISTLELDEKKVLILTAETDVNLFKSARNIPEVEVLEADKPTTYEIMYADVLIIQESAVDVLQESVEPTASEEAA